VVTCGYFQGFKTINHKFIHGSRAQFKGGEGENTNIIYNDYKCMFCYNGERIGKLILQNRYVYLCAVWPQKVSGTITSRFRFVQSVTLNIMTWVQYKPTLVSDLYGTHTSQIIMGGLLFSSTVLNSRRATNW